MSNKSGSRSVLDTTSIGKFFKADNPGDTTNYIKCALRKMHLDSWADLLILSSMQYSVYNSTDKDWFIIWLNRVIHAVSLSYK